MEDNKKPKLNKKSFICPICNTVSLFTWRRNEIYTDDNGNYTFRGGRTTGDEINIYTCENCKLYLVWRNDDTIYPIVSLAP